MTDIQPLIVYFGAIATLSLLTSAVLASLLTRRRFRLAEESDGPTRRHSHLDPGTAEG